MGVRFVQAIPFGRPLGSAKIKVDENGDIWIFGPEKNWHLKDIYSAIRQQLLHVLWKYSDVLITAPLQVLKKSKKDEYEDILKSLKSLIEKIQLQNNKQLGEVYVEFLKESGILVGKIKEIIEKNEQIALGVSTRINYLIGEQKRCEEKINAALENWLAIYEILSEKPKEKYTIKWHDFFYRTRVLQTLKVNPFRERIQSKEVKFLQYNFYTLVRADLIEEAKGQIFRAIEKVIPLYSKEIDFDFKIERIKKEGYKIQGGKLKW